MAERKRSYRPGVRNVDLEKRTRDGLMSESRWAWVRVVTGQFVILVEDSKIGRTIRLYHPTRGRPVDWNLTALTEEELLKLKELFDSAFEWALPEVQRRDKEAADAFAKGDDSHARIYRQAPQLVYRKRPEQEHGEGVQQRPSGVPQGDSGGVDLDGGVRGLGDGLAEYDSGEGGSQDDGPKVDKSPKL